MMKKRATKMTVSLSSYLKYLKSTNKRLWLRASGQISSGARLAYWNTQWTTVKKSQAYKRWVSRQAALQKRGFTLYFAYLKETNVRMYRQAFDQIKSKKRVSFWWNKWQALRRSSAYRKWRSTRARQVNAAKGVIARNKRMIYFRPLLAYLRGVKNTKMYNLALQQIRLGQRTTYWKNFWVKLSKSSSFKSWSSKGSRKTMVTRITKKQRQGFSIMLSYLRTYKRALFRKAYAEIRRGNRIQYWDTQWSTLQKNMKFKSWWKSVRTAKTRVVKFTKAQSRGFSLMTRYIKTTDVKLYKSAMAQLRSGKRLTFWWRYWTKLQNTAGYKAWYKKNYTRTVVKQSTLKQFQIHSKLGKNIVVFIGEYMGESHYRLRIRKARGDRREWFVYDEKTSSIRLASDPRFVLALQKDHNKAGAAVTMRPFKSQFAKEVKTGYSPKTKQIANGGGLCLDSVGGSKKNHNPVTFWECNKALTHQQWYPVYKKASSRAQISASNTVKPIAQKK